MTRLGADVEDTLHKRVADFAHERGIDIKRVLIPAVEQYLGLPPTEPHLLSRHARQLDLLVRIIEDGEKDDVDLVVAIVKRIAADVKKRPKRKK